MAEKTKPKPSMKRPVGSKTTKKSKPRYKKSKGTADFGIVVVDDSLEIDQEKVNEERRAYLEEARSQEAID